MNPTPGDVHIDGVLTNISVAFANQNDWIADRVFPNVPVQSQSDKYWVYKREDWLRTDVQLRAPATESPGGGWRLDNAQYFADVYAIHKDIDDQTRANADPALNLERDATRWVTQQMLLKRDKLWAAKYFVSGAWNVNAVQTGVASASPSTNQFSQLDYSTAGNPIAVLRNQITVMAKLTGYRPNTLIMGAEVWQKGFADHPKLIERIQYTQFGAVSEDLLARLLGIENVIIAWGIENTAAEGQSGAYNFLFGKSMLLLYRTPNAGLLTPSAGYTFSWNGYLGAAAQGQRIKRFRMENIASDRVEGEMAFDMKVVTPEMGIFFASVVA